VYVRYAVGVEAGVCVGVGVGASVGVGVDAEVSAGAASTHAATKQAMATMPAKALLLMAPSSVGTLAWEYSPILGYLGSRWWWTSCLDRS